MNQELILVLFLGSMIEDDEALRRTRANFDETIQSEKLCLDQEHFPGKAVQQDYHMPDVITVRVQTGKCCFKMCINIYNCALISICY